MGRAAENAVLQAAAMGLAAGVACAFGDEGMREVMGPEKGATPLDLVAAGKRR